LTHSPLRDGLEYSDLIEISRTLTRDHRSAAEVFRRAVFNIVSANDDDHGRNHAFLMDAAGDWKLAPAFDLTWATYPLASGFRAARVAGKAAGINRKDLVELGKSHDIGNCMEIIAQVTEAVARWNRFAAAKGVSPSNAAMVAQQHRPGM
jgi:serine/threonine-protein kinase HipA